MTRSLAIVLTLVVTPALGKITWTPSDIEERRRRLEFNLVQTSTGGNATWSPPDCVVGGFESSNPLKIYVGGPCHLLDITGANPEPMDGFRWVEMETVHLDLENSQGEAAPMKDNNGISNDWPVIHAEDKTTHAEVGSCGLFAFTEPTIADAGFFAGTTSYLVKQNVEYKTNDFVVGKDGSGGYKKLELCVQSCCDPVPAGGCECTGGTCRDSNLVATPGDFKYSILAAAFDLNDNSDKGWAKCVESFGEGSPKALAGYNMVYQTIDFTGMNADTVTVNAPDGSSTTYASMTACSLTNMDGCVPAAVLSMTLAADGWEGLTYTFPQYFNRGQWTEATNGAVTGAPMDSKKVEIHAVKVDDASLQMLGLASGKKAFLIRYKFDITGIDAAYQTGKYMVYDPTVNTVSGAQAKAASAAAAAASSSNSSSNSSSSSGSSSTATTSDARTSAGLTVLAALMMLLNVFQ